MITDDDLLQALDRISRTPDGSDLYLWLQRRLMAVMNGPAEASALNFENGRRSLAAELISRMAKGIAASGGRTDQSDGKRTERPIVFAPRQPVSTGARRPSAREYLAEHDPELTRPSDTERSES